MSTIPTWPKATGALGTTTKEFGALDWANLISDYYNGVNIGLLDASKLPVIGTLTRYKYEKLATYDPDESHYVVFSADDIDTGANRKIKIRRMNTPFEEDHLVLEGQPTELFNKTINFSLNTATNIGTTAIADNSITLAKMTDASVGTSEIINGAIMNIDVNSSAAIAWTKLDKTGSILDDIADVVITTVASQDIIMRNASSQWINLAKGANNESLTISSGGIIDWDLIDNANIDAAAAIVTTKLADSANFLLKTLDNSFGAHYFDITRMTAPVNPTANDARFFIEQIDTNNDGVFVHIKKNGSFQKVQMV